MPPRVTVGDLSEVITIEGPIEVDDGQGGTTTTWGVSPDLPLPIWASIEPEGRDLETIANMALMASAAYRVTVRYQPALRAVQRILWTPYRATAPKILQIHSVVPTSDKRWSVMRCSEVQG